MAAYAAVISLQRTIIGLLLNPTSPSSSREMLELADKEASSLLQVLEALNGSGRSRSSMERVDALEAQIRDSAHKLEDSLEFHELKQPEEDDDGDKGAMGQEIRSFGEAARRLEKEYLAELSKDDHNADEDTTTGPSEIDFGVEMIGRSSLFNTILKDVLYRMRPDDRYVFVFVGEEGSGMRLPVKAVFENSREAGDFERWGWAMVRGNDPKHVLVSLIAQVEPDHVDLYDELINVDASKDVLSKYLYKALENRSYMIVLDGVDDKELLDYLLMTSFPDQSNGSAILVTTSSWELTESANFWFDYELDPVVYEEDLWFRMRRQFFGRDSIPPELEIAGKEIVRNCRCRVISVIKTMVFLSKSNNMVEQLSKLAADKENLIFTVADEISESNEILKETRSVGYAWEWINNVAEYARNWINAYSSVESVNLQMYPERKVFDGGLCPAELEKAGRKIAEKCDGLPLLILTVADQLRKVEQSEEYWNNVASGKEKSVFKHAHHQISEALLPIYHKLPQNHKPCFLYLGVFLEKYDIPASNLSNLWISEKFLKPNMFEMEEDFVTECLCELVDNTLVMVQHNDFGSHILTCRLHSIFWHLSNSQAQKSKFFHAMNSYYDDCSIENIANQHRLCIRDNILLSLKDVQKLVASNTSVHSFLCVGPLHQYPVPLNFDLKLLRVMNALTIRLYEFPIEVTSLFHLRYLSLTCTGELPKSISKLRKLQYLIVKQYMNIKSSKISPYLPLEIWDMKELKHLQIMGGCLPDHRRGSGLLKLSTLLEVSAQSCREGVLKWIPNLKRLGIRTELAPTDECNSFPDLYDIYHLDWLESLKLVVVNPRIGSKSVPPPTFLSLLPPNLKKLSLSGLGYPWEHMSRIGKLQNLEVLKLKCYAFQGPKWEMDSAGQFENLKFLLLDDMNLVNWTIIGGYAIKVEHVRVKHCYKLQDLPIVLTSWDYIKKIEIMDCAPLLVTKALGFARMRLNLRISIHRSWLASDSELHMSGCFKENADWDG